MDMIVIGGGPAGRTAAIEASTIGENVVLIEQDKIGGVCLNLGCMVVTGLNDTARFLNDAENFKKLGIITGNYEIDFNRLINGIKETTSKIRSILESETRGAGVKIIKGNAVLENDAVIVDNKEYTYDKLIIATGSRAFIPPVKGSENAIIYKDVLNLTEIPEKLIIIGSGVIAAEFSNIFSSLGSDVHILCRNKFLKMFDGDIKNYVVKNLLSNVNIHENVQVNKIDEDGISTEKGKMNGNVLFAAGMIPNSEIARGIVDIGSKNEIIVNNRMETSHGDIYAAGDVIGNIGTTSVARMEGVVAARNASGIYSEADYRYIPGAISMYYDIAFLSSENSKDSEGVEGRIPGSVGPGSFWRVLEGKTGITKTVVDKNGDIKKLFSISPSSRTTMAYISLLLREGYKVHDFDDFMETHPSTDAVYKIMKYLLNL